MKTLYQTTSPAETRALGEKLGRQLPPGTAVLLFGPLGAGKTHFTKGLAAGLGVKELIKSPTFAYVNRYETPGGRSFSGGPFYHYDLYRLEPGADRTALGYEESVADPRALHAVEWADRLEGAHPAKCVTVEITPREGDARQVALEWFDPQWAEPAAAEDIWNQWLTPLHVRAHCATVARVALDVGKIRAAKGDLVNLKGLYAAALLHDMSRLCDFRTLDRSKFFEDVTDEKWAAWKAQRATHAGRHHADIAADWLKERGYAKTAEAVRAHRSTLLAEHPEAFDTLEKKILYYADKRAKHDEVVDLAERFRDGRERNGKENDAPTRALYEEVERRTFALERELLG